MGRAVLSLSAVRAARVPRRGQPRSGRRRDRGLLDRVGPGAAGLHGQRDGVRPGAPATGSIRSADSPISTGGGCAMAPEANLAEDPLRFLSAARLAHARPRPDPGTSAACRRVRCDARPRGARAPSGRALQAAGGSGGPVRAPLGLAEQRPRARARSTHPREELEGPRAPPRGGRLRRAPRASGRAATAVPAGAARRGLGMRRPRQRRGCAGCGGARREASDVARLSELSASAKATLTDDEAWVWILRAGEQAGDALRLAETLSPRSRRALRRLAARLRRKRPLPDVRGGDILAWLGVAPGPRVGATARGGARRRPRGTGSNACGSPTVAADAGEEGRDPLRQSRGGGPETLRYNAQTLKLAEYLRFMAGKEASDLHLKPMRPPLLRVKGKLVPLKAESLQPAELEQMLLEILTPSQRTRLEKHQSVDLGYGLAGVARFRANVYIQRGSLAAVFRRIPFKLPSIEDLNLPEVLETFVHLPAGLVLITGPTGSGKSTTLAAISEERHRTAAGPHRHRSRTRSSTCSRTGRPPSPSARWRRTRPTSRRR